VKMCCHVVVIHDELIRLTGQHSAVLATPMQSLIEVKMIQPTNIGNYTIK
jgi:hypothetical protein